MTKLSIMAPKRRSPFTFPAGETRTSVRLPDGWADRIFVLASASYRSFHAEMLYLLEIGLRAEEQKGTDQG